MGRYEELRSLGLRPKLEKGVAWVGKTLGGQVYERYQHNKTQSRGLG